MCVNLMCKITELQRKGNIMKLRKWSYEARTD